MKQKQTFLTGFSKDLYGKAKRSAQEAMRKIRAKALRDSLGGYEMLFEDVLPCEFLAEIDPTVRNRHFGHRPVLWAWIGQIFGLNASCSSALGMIQTWCSGLGITPPKGNTSSYCQARQRMSESFLTQVFSRITQIQRRAIRSCDLWHGFVLKAFDGTSVKLDDTPANQEVYPQPSSQKVGCGFPVMGAVGLLNMSHGGWEGFSTGTWKEHDMRGAQKLLGHLEEGDLVLADRAFCSYELIARLQAKGVASVMRLSGARHRALDWRRGKKLSPIERLVTWDKPVKRPRGSDLSETEWEDIPDQITLRYIKMGFEDRAGQKRTLVVVTTLLDPDEHDAVEISDLYARRWDIELKFRDVKTTMGMEEFKVKSPEMAHKTLLMMMIAYNLLRFLMQKSAARADKPIAQMSLKGTLDVLVSAQSLFRGMARAHLKRQILREEIVEICATKILDIRPFRHEPRAVKRRPKPHQYLTAPRHEFREIPHKENYRKRA